MNRIEFLGYIVDALGEHQRGGGTVMAIVVNPVMRSEMILDQHPAASILHTVLGVRVAFDDGIPPWEFVVSSASQADRLKTWTAFKDTPDPALWKAFLDDKIQTISRTDAYKRYVLDGSGRSQVAVLSKDSGS